MKVDSVMTRDVRTVLPETPLKEVAAVLADHRISGVPVVDRDGVVLGVVSEADVLYKERLEPSRRGGLLGLLIAGDGVSTELKLLARTAEEAMTTPAITIGPRRPVAEAAARMLDERVNRLPVVDEDGTLLGIVTRADLVRAFSRSDAEIEHEIRSDVVFRTMWIAPEQVHVAVADGDVTLRGRVETRTEAELLEELVQRVPGVVSVSADVRWDD